MAKDFGRAVLICLIILSSFISLPAADILLWCVCLAVTLG